MLELACLEMVICQDLFLVSERSQMSPVSQLRNMSALSNFLKEHDVLDNVTQVSMK